MGAQLGSFGLILDTKWGPKLTKMRSKMGPTFVCFYAFGTDFGVHFRTQKGIEITSNLGLILDYLLEGLPPLQIGPGMHVLLQVQVLVEVQV